jgi:SRSO17 transposase
VHCRLATEIEHQQAAIGLNEYEVRGWRGWRYHVALSLLAAAFPLQQARKS